MAGALDEHGRVHVQGDGAVTGQLQVKTLAFNDGTTMTTAPAASGLTSKYVHFTGTGTVHIEGSSGVSSITDNGTGDYTVNFTSAWSSKSSYACSCLSKRDPATASNNSNSNCTAMGDSSLTASAIRIVTQREDFGGVEDHTEIKVVCVGN